jgi:signal transduction histidine kinase
MKRLTYTMMLNSRHHLVESDDIRGELNRAKLILYSNNSALVIMIIFLVSDLFLGQTFNVILDLAAFSAYVIGFISLYKGYVNFPKINLVVVTNLILILSASRDGRYSGNQFIWFPIISSIFLFFSTRQINYILICVIVSLGSIFFLEITSYSFINNGPIDASYLLANYFICFGVSLSLLMVYLFVLINSNKEAERKLNNYNLRLKKKNLHLKKLNEELDSFIYKTTHDLRSPLNSLLGIIEICKIESDINTIKSFVQLQEVSVRKLDSYILDILNLSKNTRMDLQCREVDISELIHEIFFHLEHMESSVHREIMVRQYTRFVSDAQRLNMILSNLISNAIRYRDSTKKNQSVSVFAEVKDNKLTLVVKDNGLGIPKEYQEKIFEMFFRANDKVSGSGLGLYIVKEAVEKLGGVISVRSEPGIGSEFSIVLPNMEK